MLEKAIKKWGIQMVPPYGWAILAPCGCKLHHPELKELKKQSFFKRVLSRLLPSPVRWEYATPCRKPPREMLILEDQGLIRRVHSRLPRYLWILTEEGKVEAKKLGLIR